MSITCIKGLLISFCLAVNVSKSLAEEPPEWIRDSDCGVKCLYAGLVALDVDPGPYPQFIEQCGIADSRGLSLGRIEEIAKEKGLFTLAVKTTLENLALRDERFVCVAHVDRGHFVMLGELKDSQVWIANPPNAGDISRELFAKRWDGQALLLARTPLSPEESLQRPRGWMFAIGAGALGMALWGIFWKRKRA